MSCMQRNKVIRAKITEEKYYELCDEYDGFNSDELTTNVGYNSITKENNYYFDYIVFTDHCLNLNEFAYNRKLKINEWFKYSFKIYKILGLVKLRYADYCWYNGTDSMACFDKGDKYESK